MHSLSQNVTVKSANNPKTKRPTLSSDDSSLQEVLKHSGPGGPRHYLEDKRVEWPRQLGVKPCHFLEGQETGSVSKHSSNASQLEHPHMQKCLRTSLFSLLQTSVWYLENERHSEW